MKISKTKKRDIEGNRIVLVKKEAKQLVGVYQPPAAYSAANRGRRPGQLRDSIVKRGVQTTKGPAVQVIAEDEIALWHHEGTRAHKIPRAPKPAGKWLLLIFGESYSSNAQTLLMILALSSMFTGVNNIYYTVLRVRGRIRELTALRAVVALVVLTVSGLIVTRVGIVGIGYAWIGMQAMVSIYIILKVRSRLGRAGHPAARGEREQA